MNAEANHEKELLRLCGLMVDGGLDDADMERLSVLLSTDASAREFYRGYMDVHARFLLHFEPVPDIDEPVEEPVRLHSDRETPAAQSPWWQFAASAALVLFTGLNLIQSAGNLTAARESPLPPIARMDDAEAKALAKLLADGIGIAPGEVKRMLLLKSLHD